MYASLGGELKVAIGGDIVLGMLDHDGEVGLDGLRENPAEDKVGGPAAEFGG